MALLRSRGGGRGELSKGAVRGDLIVGDRGRQRKDVPEEVELEQLFIKERYTVYWGFLRGRSGLAQSARV